MKLTRLLFLMLSVGLIFMLGCGAQGSCGVTSIKIDPATATIDHSAAVPANSVQLTAADTTPLKPGCGKAADYGIPADWSVSNPEVVTLSETAHTRYVQTTCVGASAQPVTVTATATGTDVTATAQITCQ